MSQDNILSISSLNLNSPPNWKIVAKVKYLSVIQMDKLKKCKYFYVDLYDSTGTIRAIAFDLEAERFHAVFEENRNKNIYYLIENGKIQTINKDYKIDNDFEIKLLKHSIIKEDELNNNVHNDDKHDAVKTICSKENDSSVASQSQHNELLKDRIKKLILIDKHEIDKRQKAIQIQELELALQKLFLEYTIQANDLVKKIEDLNN